MKLIDSLTSDANQVIRVALDDGSKIDLSLSYLQNQSGWFYSIKYGSILTINNKRLVNSPNMLRQFKNFLPFGLACLVTDGFEPVYIDDFTKGRALVYVLNATDVLTAETVIAQYANA